MVDVKRLLVLALVIGHLLLLRAGEAAACSCMPIEPATAVAEFDAAFVGSLTARPSSGMPFDERSEFQFAVEQWVKGDLGSDITVLAPNQGSACGFEAPLGMRVGVLLTVSNGELHGNLCTTVDADLLLAGDRPLTFDGSGAPAFLIAGPHGSTRLMLLDAEGGLLATAPDEEGWLHHVALCPAGQVMVELVEDRLVVRSTSDLSEIRRIDLDGLPYEVAVPGLWCRDPAGDSIWLGTETWDSEGGSTYRLVDAEDRSTPIIVGPYAWLDVGVDHVVAVEGVERPRVWRIPIDGTERSVLHEVPDVAGESPPGVNVWVDPTGASVMVGEWRYGDEEGGRTHFVLYDLAEGTRRWESDSLPTADGIGWADDTHFLASAYPDIDSDEVVHLLIDTVAGALEELVATPGWRSLLAGNSLVGVRSSMLSSMPTATAVVTPMRLLPSASHRLVAVLDRSASPAPTSTTSVPPTTEAPTTSATSSTTTQPVAASIPDTTGGSGAIVGYTVAGLALALGAALITAARRRN